MSFQIDVLRETVSEEREERMKVVARLAEVETRKEEGVAKEQGCIKCVQFLPTFILLNLQFLPQNFRLLPVFPLDILPNSLNIIGKRIVIHFFIFLGYILPHSNDIPFPSSQFNKLPQ